VTGYITRQTYKEGSFVHKGQILFHIDPRPFQAVLDQANAQVAQAQAQLAKTAMDVDRDTPLAKERAIAQSQLDNDIQANRAAKAAVKAAEAQVEQAQLNLEFTEVKSLVDGMAGIAQVQIGNLVNPTTVLTSVSKINPIKAYFSISEQEYIHFADRINADAQKQISEAKQAAAKAEKASIKAAELAAAEAAVALKAARLKPSTPEEMKAARDARYAARKARK